MALVRVNKANAGNTANQATYTTAAFTLTAGDVVIAFLQHNVASGTCGAHTIGASGTTLTGISWTPINSALWGASNLDRLTAWWGLAGSDTSGVLVWSIAGTTPAGACWSVFAYSGADIATPVSAEVVLNDTDATAGPVDVSALTGALTVWGAARNSNSTDGSHTGATIIHNPAHASPTRNLITLEEAGENSPSVTWPGGAMTARIVAFKIRETSVPGGSIPNTVAATYTVDTPTVTGEAIAAPAAVAAAYTVPTPTVTGEAVAAPATVAATYAVDTPTAAAAGAGAFTNRGSAAGAATTPQTINIPTVVGGGVLWFVVCDRGTVPVPTPTITSPAATFTLARSQARPEDDRRISVYWSNDYEAQTNMPVTITVSTTPSAVIWAAAEQTGVTLTGDPVAQSNSVAHASSATPATTLSAGTGQMLVVACWSGSATATPESPGTELFDLASGTTCMAGYWATAVDTTPAMTLSAASTTGFIAIETVMAGGGGAGTTVSPAAVAGVYTVDGPSSLAASTIIPATVAQVDTVPTPGLLAASTVVPATVVETFAVDTPTRLAASLVAPATVVEVDTVPTPTVLAASTVVPATVVEVDTVPTPTVGVVSPPVTVTPNEVAAVDTVPTPSLTAASLVIPATVAQVDSTPTPSILSGAAAAVTPNAVAALDTVPTPTVVGGLTAIVTPTAVAAVDTVPTPTASIPALVTPATVAEVDNVPVTAVRAQALVVPATVLEVDTVPTPTLIAGAGAVATPAVVAAPYITDTPSAFGAALIIPNTVAGVHTTPGPTAAGDATETLTPVTDIGADAWTTDTGATTGLAAALADLSEANFIQSEFDPVDSPYVAALEPGVDPGVGTGHVVSWSHRNPGPDDLDLTTELRQGYVSEASPGTLIAAWTETAIPATFTTVAKTLTVGEANTISDYTDLFLRFSANKPEAGFDPASISGLTAWYDASTLGLADGADVTSWPDLSGSGHGLTPLTSGKPTYQTSELNGLGVVRYGGVTDEHLVTSVGGDYHHFFLVAKYRLTTFASYNGLLGGDADLVLVGSSGTDIWYSYLETEYRWNGVVGTMRPAPMGVWGQMGVTKTAGWLGLKVWIGSDRGFAGRQWDGDVAEVLGYDRVLTTDERLQVEAYLADKWGV